LKLNITGYIVLRILIKKGKINMNRVRYLIHADAAYRQGFFGQGIGVAILDTGIYSHPDFGRRIRCFFDVINKRRINYDDCSHGTHVSSIIGGNGKMSQGKYMGVAPEAELIHIKVLDRRGNGNKDDVIKGIDWVIQNRHRYRIRILNISVGTIKESKSRDEQLVKAVEKAWDAGIVVVVAAGNMGPEPMTITVPGNSRKVITVGSLDDSIHKILDKNLHPSYSGCGPTAECVCKPDIVAPGSSITACNAVSTKDKRYYCMKSGTSMATPVVSGSIALLLSKYPYLSNVEIKMILHESAVNLGMPKHRQGWGSIDVEKLLKI